MFDFQKFIQDYNIPIPQGRKNTGKDWINIQCPFCDDNTNHLGFNYKKEYFHCWKCSNHNHSGYHSVYEVIQKLLPFENINKIIEKYTTQFQTYVKIHNKLNKKVSTIKVPGTTLAPIHINYLQKRNYNVGYIVDKYKIKGTLDLGKYPFRIIIPVFQKNELVTFQTRAIRKNETRYINCDPEKEIISIKDCLYNIDNCNKNYCVLIEGVFKVWRLGDNSLATLGKNYTQKQLLLLSQKFKTIYVFFDPDIYGQEKAKKICNELNNLGLEVFNIVNDLSPDDMSQKDADEFMRSLK